MRLFRVLGASALALTLMLATGCPSPEKTRYEVELLAGAAGSIQVRLAPSAALKAIKVVTADTTATTIWDVEGSALAAGTYVVLGNTPAGWQQNSPFQKLQDGTAYKVSLTGGGGETASATWTYESVPVQLPSLALEHFDGEVLIRTTPAVPVASVALLDAVGNEVWFAQAPADNGVLFPVEGFKLGSAPASWLAFEFPLTSNLIHGASYKVVVQIPASGLSQSATLEGSFVFRSVPEPQFALQMSKLLQAPAGFNAETFYGPWRVFELGSRLSSFARYSRPAAPYERVAVPLDDIRAHAPDYSYFLPAQSGVLSVRGTAPGASGGPLSKPVPINDGKGVAFAQTMSVDPATKGSLYVIESKQSTSTNGLFNVYYGEDWAKGWQLVGTGMGSFAMSRANPVLVRKLVSGLADQDQTRPYITGTFETGAGQAFGLYYLKSTGTWAAISVAGIAVGTELIGRFDLTVTDNGTMYACATVLNAPGAKVLKFNPATNVWAPLSMVGSTVSYLNPSEGEGCQISSSGDTVYAVTPRQDGSLWAVKVQGDSVTDLSAGLPSLFASTERVSKLSDLRAAPGGLSIALELYTPLSAEGSAPYLGNRVALVRNEAGRWSKIKIARLPSVGDGSLLSGGMTISRDLSTLLFAGGYSDGASWYAGNWKLQ